MAQLKYNIRHFYSKGVALIEFWNWVWYEHEYIALFSSNALTSPRLARFLCVYTGFMCAVLTETVFVQVLTPGEYCSMYFA